MPGLVRPPRAVDRWRVALLTAGGVHRPDQTPFDMDDPDGDPTFRLVPPASDGLTITHDYYDHGAADEDVNCVFPIDRLHELAGDGTIGAVAPRHVSCMGHIRGRHLETFVGETAPRIARTLVEDGVDVVVASPG